MRKLWDFHGGIHPPSRKQQTTGGRIGTLDIPDRLVVPLQQHVGAPAECLVTPGDEVDKGQPIAAARGELSVAVHAPTSGRVLAIEAHPVPHPSGLQDWCVVIEPDGEERWATLAPCADFLAMDAAALLERIRGAGISGLGGAGFPTAIKLNSAGNGPVATLIVNGAECEPYITADQMLMQERADEVVTGAEVLARILQPHQCLIAVEDNKPLAIEALTRAANKTAVEIVPIPTRYPSGGEKQLIEILTGLQVPSGGIPADIGVICQNVGTAAAAYRAVCLGEPLISRVTTVAGEALQSPGNFEVLLGTPLSHLLTQAGIDPERLHRMILGGPMMGFAIDNAATPVTKTTNCIIAATAAELPDPPPAQPCIRCGMCEQVCPMELLPQQLFWFSRSRQNDEAEALDLFDCIECGACTYVCPSAIPLVQYYRGTKGEILQHRAEQLKADQARMRFEARQARLVQEQADKEARRQARKEAAASAAHRDTAGARKAPSRADAVQAALARAQAKQKTRSRQKQQTESPQDVVALEKNLTRTRAKLERMEADLQEARETDPARAVKLEEAIDSNRSRLSAAEQALQAAGDLVTSSTDDGGKEALKK